MDFNSIALRILELAGVVAVLDFAGFLPAGLAKWIARNRLEAVLKSLKTLGVRANWDEVVATPNILERVLRRFHSDDPEYVIRLRRLLEEDTFCGKVKIGEKNHFSSDEFIDVMGGSTSIVRSAGYAQILNTHTRFKSIDSFDVVATPKTGSPILGYEFSRLVNKPLVLGEFTKAEDTYGALGLHAHLDFPSELTLGGKKVLLVDDSSTGGRKMVNLAARLRDAGATVTDALVLFEPQGKGARASLAKEGITLHSIVTGPTGRF